jgi:hypoxanthine phosphoribosyltransferase
MTDIIATPEEVDRRIEEMAEEISRRYKAAKPLFICLLRGSAPFTSKLLFALTRTSPNFHPELDYMTVKTYGSRLQSRPPELVMDLAPDTEVKGRTVIILDDVLDEGQTAEFTTNHLKSLGAAHVDLIVLVQKRKTRSVYQEASLFGFEAPDEWVIGMGMDDPRISKEAYRWTDYIGITSKD